MPCHNCRFWQGDESSYMAECHLPGVSCGRTTFDWSCRHHVAQEIPFIHDAHVEQPVVEEPKAPLGPEVTRALRKSPLKFAQYLLESQQLSSLLPEPSDGLGGYYVPEEISRRVFDAFKLPRQLVTPPAPRVLHGTHGTLSVRREDGTWHDITPVRWRSRITIGEPAVQDDSITYPCRVSYVTVSIPIDMQAEAAPDYTKEDLDKARAYLMEKLLGHTNLLIGPGPEQTAQIHDLEDNETPGD